jgi:hypothetical protein
MLNAWSSPATARVLTHDEAPRVKRHRREQLPSLPDELHVVHGEQPFAQLLDDAVVPRSSRLTLATPDKPCGNIGSWFWDLESDFVDHVQNQIIGRKFWTLLEMLG